MEIHKPYPTTPVGSFLQPFGVLGIDWHVFDDHVNINDNVISGKDHGSFTLKYRHVGKLQLLIMADSAYPIEGYHYERIDNTGYVGFNLSKLNER